MFSNINKILAALSLLVAGSPISFVSAVPYEARLETLATPDPADPACGTAISFGIGLEPLGKFSETGSFCAGPPDMDGFSPMSGQVIQVLDGDPLSYLVINNESLVNFGSDPIETISPTWYVEEGGGIFEGVTGGGSFTATAIPQADGTIKLCVHVFGDIHFPESSSESDSSSDSSD